MACVGGVYVPVPVPPVPVPPVPPSVSSSSFFLRFLLLPLEETRLSGTDDGGVE